MNTKLCRKCSQIKNIDDFHKNPKSKDGHHSNCKDCANQYAKNYRLAQDKIKRQEYDQAYYETNKEIILVRKQKYYQENKNQISSNLKQRYNKEDKVKYNKQYYEANKEIIKEQNKQYAKEHKQETRQYHNQYYKDKRKNDLTFQIRTALSANINYGLKSNGSSKAGKSIVKYLGYSIQELIQYLENQFETWMTWQNYGKYDPETWDDNDPSTWKWSIDHIIPQSKFYFISMDEQTFKDCYALSNLRPLSAKQNWLDGINRTRHKK